MTAQGDILWTPPPDARERFQAGRFLDWLAVERGLDADVRLSYRRPGAVWECIAPLAWMIETAPEDPQAMTGIDQDPGIGAPWARV